MNLLLTAIRFVQLLAIGTAIAAQNTPLFENFSHPVNLLLQRPVTIAQDKLSVEETARQVTVRILGDPSSGSGVIIRREGQTYIVLTNEHVVAFSNNNLYTIITADGRSHSAQWQRDFQFRGFDLAFVEFRSEQSYRVAEIGNSKALAVGDRVYAAGFPNWHLIDSQSLENTRDWGLKAYRLTEGSVGMLLARPLLRGYQLGYTNEIENGMSGGPLLDKNGRLIGINGRLKYPLQGMNVYRFADGTEASEELVQKMEALSWGIPSANFQNINVRSPGL